MHIVSKQHWLKALALPRTKLSPAGFGKALGVGQKAREPGQIVYKLLTVTLVTLVTFPRTLIPFSISPLSRETTLSFSGIAIMQTRYALVLFPLFCSYCFGAAGTAQSQQTSTERSRKILRRTAPIYPDVARKINLGGTVKVVAVVAADGDVKSVEPKGGSPILLKAAEDALPKWEFASGANPGRR
jgi:hypothetical protein